ncbi:MAG: VWA domain-containing protein, partial [Bacteroidota bacterium]
MLEHYKKYSSFDAALIGFTRYCRENELGIGLSHSQEALQAATVGFAGDEDTLRYSLKALFCACTEDHETFDKCFQVFWGTRKHTYNHTIQNKNTSNVVKRSNNSLVMMGFKPQGAETPKEEEEAKNVSGASGVESLKFTDFSKVSAIDSQVLDELANKLLKQLNHRLKRKLESTKQGQIDIRRTIRINMSNGDALIKLARRDRKMERYRIILLLDVSGSMDKYSFFLLKFIWSLKSSLKQIEAFVFS